MSKCRQINISVDLKVHERVGKLRGRDPFTPMPGAAPISIFELRSLVTQCRWPYACDDGETRYCGKPAYIGSWCIGHRQIAYARAAPPAKTYAPAKMGERHAS